MQPARQKGTSKRTWFIGCASVLVGSVVLCCVSAGGIAWLPPELARRERAEQVTTLRTDLQRRTAQREDAALWQRLLRALADLASRAALEARAFATLWQEYQRDVADGRLDEQELGRLAAMLTELVSSDGRSTGFEDTFTEPSHRRRHRHWH